MRAKDDLKRHAALVDRMASALGIDLEEEMLRGSLNFSELDDAVLSCTGCTQPCACERFLDGLTETVETTPDYCRNTQLFDQLKQAGS